MLGRRVLRRAGRTTRLGPFRYFSLLTPHRGRSSLGSSYPASCIGNLATAVATHTRRMLGRKVCCGRPTFP